MKPLGHKKKRKPIQIATGQKAVGQITIPTLFALSDDHKIFQLVPPTDATEVPHWHEVTPLPEAE